MKHLLLIKRDLDKELLKKYRLGLGMFEFLIFDDEGQRDAFYEEQNKGIEDRKNNVVEYPTVEFENDTLNEENVKTIKNDKLH